MEYRTEREQPITSSENNQAAASSSTTTVQVFPSSSSKEVFRRYQLENIKSLHMECLGRPMPSPISAEVLRDLDEGTPSAYYRYALTEAMYAPRPPWRYVAAIVKRCKSQLIDPNELVF